MKYITTLAVVAALSACDTTTSTSTNQVANPAENASVAANPAPKKPTFANRGLVGKRPEWKTALFKTPDQQFGNLTYFAMSKIALGASAQCGVPIDFVYFDWARGIGRRAIFQDRNVARARARQATEQFIKDYGPFDKNNPQLMCRAIERNKADRTLLGAMFF
ncbi:MAG: hypothetical protein ABJ370_12280 [Paracoccaceae bacterium]